MKKTIKKLLIVLSTAILCSLLMVGFLSGCTKKDPIDNEINVEISFSFSEKSLIIGDEEYLLPTYKKINGYTLTYSSSDSSIVSVNNDGKIVAVTEGTATIKAIYSNGTDKGEASVTVISTFGGYLPELKTMGIAEQVSITINDEYKILPYIVFNGKQFKDANVNYFIVNDDIATLNEKNEIVPKAKGSTKVIIEASWRGKDKQNTPTMQKVINLSVIDDVRFRLNGKPISDQTLYTLSEFDGKAYINSLSSNFKVSVNEEEYDAETIIENEEVLVKQSGLLVAKDFGKTTILIQKTIGDITYSQTINIDVLRVEKTVTATVPLFSTLDGTYLDVASGQKKNVLSFVNDSDKVVDAYQDGKVLKVEGDKILGVSSSSETKRGNASITVGTSKIIYHMSLETLSKAISVKEDLKVLELSDAKTLIGYYELINDIDASGISLNHTLTNDANFNGTFDGKGYSISNLVLKDKGLFGTLNATAVIKNLGLINLEATKAYFLASNTLNDGLTIQNVFISLSAATVTPRGITGRTGANSVLTNVVIEYLGDNANANRDYSERWTWQGLIGGLWTYESEGKLYAQDKKWSDVYVVSPFVVSFRSDEKKDSSSNPAAMYGYGKNETKDIYGNNLDAITNERSNPNLGEYFWTNTYFNAQFTNLYRYSSYDALKSANNDYSSFSSDYWVVFENKIYWKSQFINDLDIRLFDGNTDLGSDLKIVGVNKELKVKAFMGSSEISGIEVSVATNDYITWNSYSKVIKLVKAPETGSYTVPVTVKLKIGTVEILKTVDVMAIGELINVSKVYDLVDESTGKQSGKAFPMSEIVGNEEVVAIYQGSKLLTYDSQLGTLTGLTANIVGEGENRTVNPVDLTINTNGKVYMVKVKVYTKVITTANDLKYFNQALTENVNNVYNGYYILAGNIVDYSNAYNNVLDTYSNLKSLTGTFDGNGYSVSVKVGKGVFGKLGHGAVVKNVAFKNMQIENIDNGGYTYTGIIAGYISNSTDVAVVKDVYISIDESVTYPYREYLSKWFTSAMLVSNNSSLKSKFANIIIEANILHSNYTDNGGSQPCLFRYWDGINNATQGGQYAANTVIDSLTNVYVISKDKTNNGGVFRITANIGKTASNSMALSYNDFVNAQDAHTTLYLPNTYNNGTKDLVTLRRYDDYTQMASANNDYSLFNADCWNLTGTTPAWKNK